MEEDADFKLVPVIERVLHKFYKARHHAYRELAKNFSELEKNSPEFEKYIGLVKHFVIDRSDYALEKGLVATLAYIQNYANAGKTVGDVMSGIITKCFSSQQIKIRTLGVQITLMYVEIEQQDKVQEELLKGMNFQNPKIVSTCISACTLALKQFGSKIIIVEPWIDHLKPLLALRPKKILRDESIAMLIEIYRWMGNSLLTQLGNVQAGHLNELEMEFAKLGDEKAEPSRYLRSQQEDESEVDYDDMPQQQQQLSSASTSKNVSQSPHRDAIDLDQKSDDTRDTYASSQKSNASKSSLASSLDQIDDLEDIQDNLTKTQSQRNSLVNDKLLTQRMLAQKAMEGADSESKPSTDKNNNDFIKSPTETESTINSSEISFDSKSYLDIPCSSEASSCRSKIDENLSTGESFKRKTEDVDNSSQEDSSTLNDTVSTVMSVNGIKEVLEIRTQQPWCVCVDLPTKFEIHLTSHTNHWQQVTIALGEIKLANGGVHHPKQIIVKIMPIMDEVLLKSNATEYYTFTVTSFLSNDIKVTFHVQVKDMATKLTNVMEYEVILKSETPNLIITTELIDFELNPEDSQKTLPLEIINNSRFNLPLNFTISQEYEWIFMFGSPFESTQSKSADCSDSSSSTSDIIHIEYSTVVLANTRASIPLVMRSPSLDQNTSIVNVDGTVWMCLSCDAETKKFIREIRLQGRIGLARIQCERSCWPLSCALSLQLGQTKSFQVKNVGVVPIDLAVCFEPDDGCFQADQKQIPLEPESIGTIQITYQGNASKSLSTQIKRTLRLVYGSTRVNFIFPLEATSSTGTISCEFFGSRSNSHTSDTGTVNYFSDGKLPIDATKIELVWGCIRPGKSSIQEFVLRNRSSQRLRIQVIIENVGASSSTAIGIASLQSSNFRFVKDGCITDMNLSLQLHKKESRTISVAFCPHSNGAAAARLIFKPLISEVETGNLKTQKIQLYGYGGYTLIDIQKVAKDSAGRMWLSFGRLDYHRETLHQTFILRNTGTLAAFACLNVSCKALYPFMDSSVKILPTEIVIDPNREVEICVSFTPRPDDFKYIDSKSAGLEVAEIASVQILSGSESTRARIRRLFKKTTAQNHHQSPSPTSRSALQSLSTEFLVPRLSATFPGEQTSSDANLCRESPGAMRNLLRDLDNRELILTIERDIGTECNLLASGIADESLLFKSLVCPADNTTLQETGRKSGSFCTIEPRHLMLAPPIKCADTVLIRSQHSQPMRFEINVPSTAVAFGVHVTPAKGLLLPNVYTAITVQCNPGQIRSLSTCNIMVYVENEVMDIEIKIQFIQSST